jgi:hypothetical protein
MQEVVTLECTEAKKEGKPALDNQNVDYSEAEFEKILAARRDLRSQASFVKPDEPELLKNIEQWRMDQAYQRTKSRRPDLLINDDEF